jgi:hypothetical protein
MAGYPASSVNDFLANPEVLNSDATTQSYSWSELYQGLSPRRALRRTTIPGSLLCLSKLAKGRLEITKELRKSRKKDKDG